MENKELALFRKLYWAAKDTVERTSYQEIVGNIKSYDGAKHIRESCDNCATVLGEVDAYLWEKDINE